MEIIIKDNDKAEQFINIFQNIKLLSDSFCVEFNEDCFYVQGMDASHISIFEINLSKEWFDEYSISKNAAIGMTSNIFPRILMTWTNDHSIKLSMSNDDHLDVAFEKNNGNIEYNKYFEVPLIDLDVERLNIPDQEYSLDIEFDSRKLKKLIDELSIFGEQVNLICNETEINATSKSIEGSMKIHIPFDDIESYSIEEGEVINVTYSLKYIKYMCVFNKVSPCAQLYITSGQPLQFKYSMDETSYLRFYIAPSIDDD
jgi:proliferating cell nuclear antigen